MTFPEEGEVEHWDRPLREWLADLDAPDSDWREDTASALGFFVMKCHLDDKPVPTAVVTALVDALGDPQSCVRGKAARALGEVGKEARHAVPVLIDLLDGYEEDEARADIIKAIGALGGTREAAATLLRLLQEGAEVVRVAASEALGNADLLGLVVEEDLLAFLSDDSPQVRTWVCWALWRLSKQAGEMVPILLAALIDGRARLDAARLLCFMGEQAAAALPRLLALRDDPSWTVRIQAVRATTNIPCPDEVALPVLEALRDDPNEIVRLYVAMALEKRGRP